MGISLAIYVGWTVAGMVMLRNHTQRMMNEIGKGVDGFQERVEAAEAMSIAASGKLMRFWKPVLWAAGAPALVAALLLAGAAWSVASVARRPTTPSAIQYEPQ